MSKKKPHPGAAVSNAATPEQLAAIRPWVRDGTWVGAVGFIRRTLACTLREAADAYDHLGGTHR